jgi:hypothetical protein
MADESLGIPQAPHRTGINYALGICAMTAIACGVGWYQARRETNRGHELNRQLAAELAALHESIAAAQEKIDESSKLVETRLTNLDKRIAKLININHRVTAERNENAVRRHGQAYSFVGMIDLDGDGKDDRDLLKEIVATAGGVIDNDIDPKGDLHVHGKLEVKPELTTKTKFVVIGTIPSMADASDLKERKAVESIIDRRQELETQARAKGVRIVSLGDFLNYVGYKTQHRRRFVPGDEPYKLKSVSPSATQPESKGRSSDGDDPNQSEFMGNTRNNGWNWDGPRRAMRSRSKPFRRGRPTDGAIVFEKLPDK